MAAWSTSDASRNGRLRGGASRPPARADRLARCGSFDDAEPLPISIDHGPAPHDPLPPGIDRVPDAGRVPPHGPDRRGPDCRGREWGIGAGAARLPAPAAQHRRGGRRGLPALRRQPGRRPGVGLCGARDAGAGGPAVGADRGPRPLPGRPGLRHKLRDHGLGRDRRRLRPAAGPRPAPRRLARRPAVHGGDRRVRLGAAADGRDRPRGADRERGPGAHPRVPHVARAGGGTGRAGGVRRHRPRHHLDAGLCAETARAGRPGSGLAGHDGGGRATQRHRRHRLPDRRHHPRPAARPLPGDGRERRPARNPAPGLRQRGRALGQRQRSRARHDPGRGRALRPRPLAGHSTADAGRAGGADRARRRPARRRDHGRQRRRLVRARHASRQGRRGAGHDRRHRPRERLRPDPSRHLVRLLRPRRRGPRGGRPGAGGRRHRARHLPAGRDRAGDDAAARPSRRRDRRPAAGARAGAARRDRGAADDAPRPPRGRLRGAGGAHPQRAAGRLDAPRLRRPDLAPDRRGQLRGAGLRAAGAGGDARLRPALAAARRQRHRDAGWTLPLRRPGRRAARRRQPARAGRPVAGPGRGRLRVRPGLGNAARHRADAAGAGRGRRRHRADRAGAGGADRAVGADGGGRRGRPAGSRRALGHQADHDPGAADAAADRAARPRCRRRRRDPGR